MLYRLFRTFVLFHDACCEHSLWLRAWIPLDLGLHIILPAVQRLHLLGLPVVVALLWPVPLSAAVGERGHAGNRADRVGPATARLACVPNWI